MTRLLAEDLLLLCWNDEKGGLHQRCSTTVGPGIGGALVIDAVLAGALVIADGRVQVTGTDPGDLMLTEVVAAAGRRRPPGVARLVQEVGTPSRYKAIRDRLVEQGVLRADRRRVLGLVPSTRFPPADPATTEVVRERVRALLTGRAEPADAEPRAMMLASLAVPTGAIDLLVARGERTRARRRAEAFSNPHAALGIGQAVQEAQITAMAAVAAAVTAGTATSTAGAPQQPDWTTAPVRDPRRDAGAGDGHAEESVAHAPTAHEQEPATDVPVRTVRVEEAPAEDLPPDPVQVDEPVADVPARPAPVGQPVADVPARPAPVGKVGAAAVDEAGARRRAQPPPEGDVGVAGRVGVGIGVGAALLIGIGVVRRRLAPRARKRPPDD
ncbi:MAG: GPP34 family phosphoprotein [Egibacteraceae bacterium]